MVCNLVLLALDAARYGFVEDHGGTPSDSLHVSVCCILVGNQHFGDAVNPLLLFSSHAGQQISLHTPHFYIYLFMYLFNSVVRLIMHFHESLV